MSRSRLVAGLVAVALTASACAGMTSRNGGTGSGGQSTDAGTRYGAAPTADPDVTFQPEVVLVGGGGNAVRSVTSDGLTWRLDAKAAKANELTPGRIMFVTGRGVGRVLDVRHEGDDLLVTVGPVGFTDVVKDGLFASQGPVGISDVTAYEAGDAFWADSDVGESKATDEPPGLRSTPALRLAPPPEPGKRPTMPAPKKSGTSALKVGGFDVSAQCCAGGVGVTFTYDSGGVRLAGTVTLLMSKPSAKFALNIKGGTVTQAELQIEGGAGIKVDIAGATNTGAGANVNKLIVPAVDFSVPIGQMLGVPLSATVTQLFGVQTAFSAKDGNIKASGEWGIEGGLGFGYANNSFGVRAPKDLKVKNSITDSISGISVGVNGIILTYQAKFLVGFGQFGFTVGVYFGLTITAGLTIGSAAGAPLALCRSAQVGVWASYGIGYRIPAPVADLINFFLEKFNTKPIERQAGIGENVNTFNKYVVTPDKPICRA